VFKSLSAGDAAPASFERSSRLLASLLRDAGIDPAPLRLMNGSGLFDANRVSAGAIAKLLSHAHGDPRVGPELVAHLAIGGVDGTLRHRFKSHADKRAIRAKSGTLASASTLSGYVLVPGGRAIAFSVLINGAKGKTVALREDIDRFIGSLADAL
jgi:D-alanyl-D-alanine carboxypeptidase/D-alanyl-D-alanine-endopeptidase (penicillin-binding protein 4)